jgi:hypothetical protein
MSFELIEAPRPQGGASRKGNFVHIVPLDPAYKAGLAGHVPVKIQNSREPLTIPDLSLPPRIRCGVDSGGSPVLLRASGFLLEFIPMKIGAGMKI